MKRTDPAYIAIANWFNGHRNYADGVDLYFKYGTNRNLKGIFPGHANRYQRKLEYELTKIIGVDFKKLDRIPMPDATVNLAVAKHIAAQKGVIPGGPNVKLPDYNPDEPQAMKMDEMKQLPVIIRRIMHEYHDLYQKRTICHTALKKVEGNSDGDNAQRAELVSQMDKFSARMDKLQKANKEWDSTGQLPIEADLWEPKPATVELNRIELLEKKKNIQKSLSKDKSLLMYQSKKQGSEPRPIPEGPKRKKIEARIDQKEKEIVQINKAIHDIDKAQ